MKFFPFSERTGQSSWHLLLALHKLTVVLSPDYSGSTPSLPGALAEASKMEVSLCFKGVASHLYVKNKPTFKNTPAGKVLKFKSSLSSRCQDYLGGNSVVSISPVTLYISNKQEPQIRKTGKGSWAGEREFHAESPGSRRELICCCSGSAVGFQDVRGQILSAFFKGSIFLLLFTQNENWDQNIINGLACLCFEVKGHTVKQTEGWVESSRPWVRRTWC